MTASEHEKQAEMLLKEAQEGVSEYSAEERLVWVTAALAHATLANAQCTYIVAEQIAQR